MERILSAAEARKVTDFYPDYFTFNAEEWFSHPENYALKEGENISFGEYKSPGVYWVHFCFHTAKGREAINLTKRMLESFCIACSVKIAIGLIELKNKKARWLIRQVGFKSLGETDTKNGICEMFYHVQG